MASSDVALVATRDPRGVAREAKRAARGAAEVADADTAAGTMAGTRRGADARTRVAAYAQRPASAPLLVPRAAMFARGEGGVWARRDARGTGAHRGPPPDKSANWRRVRSPDGQAWRSDYLCRCSPPGKSSPKLGDRVAHSEVREYRRMATPLKTRGNAAVGSAATDARILTALFLGVIVGALAAMFTKHPGDCPVCACAGTA